MERGTMTLMIWLLALMGVGLTLCAVTSLLVLCQIQLKWMRAFGEQHGIQALSTVARTEEKKPVIEKQKLTVSMPIPGGDLIRKMRKPNG